MFLQPSWNIWLSQIGLFPQGWNNWKHKDRQVQIAWNKNPSDNTQLQIDFEDGCIGRVNQTWSFFLVVYFSQDVFWAGGSAFFVETFRKNTSSVVMEEYSKWAMDSKQNLHTFNRSWMSRCLYFLERLHSSSPSQFIRSYNLRGRRLTFKADMDAQPPWNVTNGYPRKMLGFKQSPFEKKVSTYGCPPWILQCRWMLMRKNHQKSEPNILFIISVKVFRMRCQRRIQGD